MTVKKTVTIIVLNSGNPSIIMLWAQQNISQLHYYVLVKNKQGKVTLSASSRWINNLKSRLFEVNSWEIIGLSILSKRQKIKGEKESNLLICYKHFYSWKRIASTGVKLNLYQFRIKIEKRLQKQFYRKGKTCKKVFHVCWVGLVFKEVEIFLYVPINHLWWILQEIVP